MKNSSRRPVKSPVGNKTKRGAELEGTPKTPRSFDVSPCKSTGKSSCVDIFTQQLEDRRLQSRPLQWNKLAKQGVNAMAAEGMTKDSPETTLSPFLHWDLKSTGETVAVTALSPICVNAIRGNTDQQGGCKAAMKKPSVMPPSQMKVKDSDAALKRKGHARLLEDAHWIASEDYSAAGPGSCLSSPQNRISLLSEEQIFFWSNAAFNHGLAHEETFCISKDTASLSSCSSSRSCSRHKAAITERADCEAESKSTDQDPLLGIDGGRGCNANRESPIVDATAKTKNGMGSSKSSGPEDQETRHDCTTESTLARKLLFEDGKSYSCVHLLQQTKEHTDIQKSVLQASQAPEKRFEIGLDEIEQEIQRLTERLTELHLQKRVWEKEMRRHGEEIKKKAESVSYVGRKGLADRERSVVAVLQQRQCKRAVVSGAKRGKGPVSISSNSAQSMRFHEVVSKVKEGSPLASVSRRVQCPLTGSVGKLWELRRSVSAASRRKESSSGSSDAEADRSTVLRRRLSMSGVMRSSPSNVPGQQQQQSLPSKGICTPSRVVSSRYGRAITPDAGRLSCHKQDRLSSVASSPLPQRSTSVVCSPLKKFVTLRSGYPSRSGFATPTKEREQLTSIRAAATVCPPNTGHSLHSSSGARVDSPKSTAALHKCLESLLEDSKHIFKPQHL